MKKTVLKATLFALVVGNSCGSSAEDTNAASLLLKAPAVSGDSYRCEDMVRAVNALRRLGKAEAIAVLKGHLKDYDAFILPQEHEKILLVCRLLFSNPQGWATPRLGRPYPEVNWQVAARWPLFPIAIQDNVPFLLLTGYGAVGYSGDTAEKCVKACEAFPLVAEDLSSTNYIHAANALIGTEAFQSLYKTGEGKRQAEEMVLKQAVGTGHGLPAEGSPPPSAKGQSER